MSTSSLIFWAAKVYFRRQPKAPVHSLYYSLTGSFGGIGEPPPGEGAAADVDRFERALFVERAVADRACDELRRKLEGMGYRVLRTCRVRVKLRLAQAATAPVVHKTKRTEATCHG